MSALTEEAETRYFKNYRVRPLLRVTGITIDFDDLMRLDILVNFDVRDQRICNNVAQLCYFTFGDEVTALRTLLKERLYVHCGLPRNDENTVLIERMKVVKEPRACGRLHQSEGLEVGYTFTLKTPTMEFANKGTAMLALDDTLQAALDTVISSRCGEEYIA